MRAIVAAAVLVGGVGAGAQPVTLQVAVERALASNPKVLSAVAEVEAAEAAVGAESRLLYENPTLSAAAGPRLGGAAQALDLGASLSQPIELAGQGAARVAAARALLVAVRADHQAARTEAVAQVHAAFITVLAAKERHAAAEIAARFAARAVQVARERLKAGDVSQLDVDAALVELGRARREVASSVQQVAAARADLAALLAMPAEEDPEPTGTLESLVRAVSLRLESGEAAGEVAVQQRPELRGANARLEAAKARASLADRSAFPDAAVGVSYEREGTEQVLQGTVSLELPLFERNQGARASAGREVRQAQLQVALLERELRREARMAFDRFRRASEAAALFTSEINAAAERIHALSEEGYRAGKLSLFELLATQRAALEARRGYADALEELAVAAAHLRRAIGVLPGEAGDR